MPEPVASTDPRAEESRRGHAHSPVSPVGRYVTIDAWRGVAALSVLLFHSFGAFYDATLWAPLHPIRAVAWRGWLGLHLFFVLSGYCIFERLRVALHRGERPGAFLVDRVLRIFPVYWAALLLSVALNGVTHAVTGAASLSPLSVSPGDWLANLTLTHVFVGSPSFILVTWTLTCECSFYLISAALLALARTGAGLTGSFTAGALLCLTAFVMPASGWALPLATWPDFFAGMTVSFALGGRRAAAFAVLGALTLAAWLPLEYHASDSRRFALAFAWLLLALRGADDWLSRRAMVRVLGWVGVFSYSLYLLHVQFASRVLNLGTRFLQPASAMFAVLWMLAIAAAVLGGWLFWRAVEKPCERWRIARRQSRLASS
ncbi:MAG: acyltransferase [Opitutaceae bacterium]|nr:acyltransferase [Opitutaceae bacterium]